MLFEHSTNHNFIVTDNEKPGIEGLEQRILSLEYA